MSDNSPVFVIESDDSLMSDDIDAFDRTTRTSGGNGDMDKVDDIFSGDILDSLSDEVEVVDSSISSSSGSTRGFCEQKSDDHNDEYENSNDYINGDDEIEDELDAILLGSQERMSAAAATTGDAGSGPMAAPQPRPMPPAERSDQQLAAMTPADVRNVLLPFFRAKRKTEDFFAEAERFIFPFVYTDTHQKAEGAGENFSSGGGAVVPDAVRDRCARLVNISAWTATHEEFVLSSLPEAAASGRSDSGVSQQRKSLPGGDAAADVLLPSSLVPLSDYYRRHSDNQQQQSRVGGGGGGSTGNSSMMPLRRHQIEGVRFMWSLLAEGPVGRVPSVGCILSHSMGLGKTAQVVVFLHLFLQAYPERAEAEGKKPRALICVPKSTLSSWTSEFRRWGAAFPPASRVTPVVLESSMAVEGRKRVLRTWNSTGGVLLVNYEGLVSLMNAMRKEKKRTASSDLQPHEEHEPRQGVHGSFNSEKEENIPPFFGPHDSSIELLVCDEAHRLKGQRLGSVLALRSLHPRRRLLLTGTPLQNNLMEYWSMIDFAMYKFFDRKRFRLYFLRPIQEAASSGASMAAVKEAKSRTYTLVQELRPFVLRVDSTPLRSELPPLHETVLVVKLSERQRELYLRFADIALSLNGDLGLLFATVALDAKIGSHPALLYAAAGKGEEALDEVSREYAALRDTEDTEELRVLRKRLGRAVAKKQNLPRYCFDNFKTLLEPPEGSGNYRLSFADGAKMRVALHLIAASMRAGEKVLVFSLRTQTLDLFEVLIAEANRTCVEGTEVDVDAEPDGRGDEGERESSGPRLSLPHRVGWVRLDGGSTSRQRAEALRTFQSANGPNVFLISTKAGGVGITITAATRVIIFDSGYNPADDQQAVGRAYRYGQKRPVHVYRLLSAHTLEQWLFFKKLAKEWVFQATVEEQMTARDGLQGASMADVAGALEEAEAAIRRHEAPTATQATDTARLAARDPVLASVKPLTHYACSYSAFLQKDEEMDFDADDRLFYDTYKNRGEFAIDSNSSAHDRDPFEGVRRAKKKNFVDSLMMLSASSRELMIKIQALQQQRSRKQRQEGARKHMGQVFSRLFTELYSTNQTLSGGSARPAVEVDAAVRDPSLYALFEPGATPENAVEIGESDGEDNIDE